MARNKEIARPPTDPTKAKAARSLTLILTLVGFSLLLYAMTVAKLIG